LPLINRKNQRARANIFMCQAAKIPHSKIFPKIVTRARNLAHTNKKQEKERKEQKRNGKGRKEKKKRRKELFYTSPKSIYSRARK